MDFLFDTTGAPKGTRALGDVASTRDLIYQNVLDAAKSYPAVSNQRYILELVDPAFEGAESFSRADEKKAVLGGQSLGRRLRGTWRLRKNDDTKELLDEKRTTLASVPHMTPRGTFILGGNEYSLSHQMRLRPGIFTRIKESGELESHVNVARGFGHRYFLDPESGIFRIQFGQARMPLMPVLRALGATDKQIRDAWGNDLFVANAQKSDPATIKKLYKKLARRGTAASEMEMHDAIRAAFDEMELDPEVMKRTLGHPYAKVDPEVILAATQKLLRVHKGEELPDDRDAMAFQRTIGPEDLFAERLRKGAEAVRRALWRATLPGNLQRLPPGLFEKYVRGAILDTKLGAALEQINPGELYDQRMRVTRMGEGGIPSADAVPDECFDAKTEVFTARGWLRWPDVVDDDLFACQIRGRMEYHLAHRLIRKHYSGKLFGIKTRTLDHLVTPMHRMWCRKYRNKGRLAEWCFELAEDGFRRPRQFQVACLPLEGHDVSNWTLPITSGARTILGPFRITDWAAFLGWYLSEGGMDKYALRVRSKYHITISQDTDANPVNVRHIAALLTRMRIPYSYHGHNFVIVNKQLGHYLTSCGTSAKQKCMPDEVFEWPESARRALFESLVAGDGHRRANGSITFTTTSARLNKQFCRLATTLGYAARMRKPRVHKNKAHNDTFACGVLLSTVQGITSARQYATCYYKQIYNGAVYCAEVPGGLLLVRRNGSVPMWSGNSRNVQPSHLGFIDPVHTPESEKIGIDSRIAIRTLKAKDGRLYSRFIEPKTGNIIWKSPQDVADAVVAFPGELESNAPFVRVQHEGKLKYVPRDKVDYQLAHMTEAFGPLASMVPLKPAAFGQRVSMGSRMITQALPLVDPEAPLVQSGVPGMKDTSFEDLLGTDMGAVRSDIGGTVLEVTPTHVKIRGSDRRVHYRELYENYPYNRKTFVHNTPAVRPGDQVKPGQLLAYSNFTDKSGTTALGKNARVAYMPYKGYNFEDAIVISESFAKRASSEHMYQNTLDMSEGVRASKNAYVSIFPGKYDRKLLEKYDDDGVVKVGQTVETDEPLVLAVKESTTGPRLGRRKASWSDATISWDHHAPGLVTDVYKGKKEVGVIVKSVHPTQVGDKFAGRFGDKGVVATIVPDEDMPHDAQGKPFEVLLNPLGIISRGNPAQIIEAQLGKIAALTGKPYKLADFDTIRDLREYVERELRTHGLSDTEAVADPKTDRIINNVATGNRFIMKLHHTAEAKLQGRAAGGGYTAEGAPAKGGPSGSKRVGMLELNALLSHGAYHTIRDASIIRGQRNEDYWRMLMSGYAPPEPKVPFTYQKFLEQLRGAGINPVRTGTNLQVMAMSNDAVKQLTGDRAVRKSDTVNWRISKLTPIKGGLFDEALTGGHGGNRWSYIPLYEPLPNPVMEEPIRRILDLTQKQFLDIVAGRTNIPGREHLTGPPGIKQALDDVNLDKEIERAHAEIAGGKKTYRDKAIRRLQYLKSAKELGQHPRDWVLDRVPVLPPIFRPVSLFADTNTPLIDDSNYLYKEVIEANDNLHELSKITDDVADERLALYKAFKGVTGLGDPISPEFQEQDVKGILKQIFGPSPKFGTVQRKLLGSTVDLVGRATITPNPNLDMDQVGLPIDEAWTLYQPFIVRRLVRRGMRKLNAMQETKDRTPRALRELQAEMKERPVIINRAPVLHRYGVMAFWPQLTSSDTLEIPPLIVGGFGADFDGDAMQFHVPSSDDAVEEAKDKLLPSKNLLATSDFDIHYAPSQEYIGGLWAATTQVSPTPPRVFKSKRDAIAAYMRGEISPGQQVEIVG